MHIGPQITYLEFVKACETGNLLGVELGIETLSIQEVIAYKNMALICAAEKGRLEVVKRLLEIRAVRREEVASNNEALRLAAENGHLAVVNRLLEVESVVGQVTVNNNEALRWAVIKRHYGVAARLLKESSVLRYLREHKEEGFVKNNKPFFDKLEKLTKGRYMARKIFRMTSLPKSIVDQIITFAFHDVMCGKSTCDAIRPGEGITGKRACPVIFDFKRRRPKVNSVAVSLSELALAEDDEASSCEVLTSEFGMCRIGQ